MNLHAKRLGQDHDWWSSKKQFNKLCRVGGIEDGAGWDGGEGLTRARAPLANILLSCLFCVPPYSYWQTLWFSL